MKKALFLLIYVFLHSTVSAECYHSDSSIYLSGFRQRVGDGLIHAREGQDGGVILGYEQPTTISGKRTTVMATYGDVSRRVFVYRDSLLKLCDSYFFGGVWANVEDKDFLKGNSFVLQLDKAPESFSLLLANSEWDTKLFLVAIEVAGGNKIAVIEWQRRRSDATPSAKVLIHLMAFL